MNLLKKKGKYLFPVIVIGLLLLIYGSGVIGEDKKIDKDKKISEKNQKIEEREKKAQIAPEEIAENQSKLLKEDLVLSAEKQKEIKEIILKSETEKQAIIEKLKTIDDEKDEKIKSVLNPEQKEKYEKLITNIKRNMPDRQKGPQPPDKRINPMNEFLMESELTNEQKIQIKEVVKNFESDMRAIDEVAMNEFYAILLPEQKEKFEKQFSSPEGRFMERDKMSHRRGFGHEGNQPSNMPSEPRMDRELGFAGKGLRFEDEQHSLPKVAPGMMNPLKGGPKPFLNNTRPKAVIPNEENLDIVSQELNLTPSQKDKLKEIILNRSNDIKISKDFVKQDLQKILSPEKFKEFEERIDKFESK